MTHYIALTILKNLHRLASVGAFGIGVVSALIWIKDADLFMAGIMFTSGLVSMIILWALGEMIGIVINAGRIIDHLIDRRKI